jgi:hypothetical protein
LDYSAKIIDPLPILKLSSKDEFDIISWEFAVTWQMASVPPLLVKKIELSISTV